jgi:hypothetical protein
MLKPRLSTAPPGLPQPKETPLVCSRCGQPFIPAMTLPPVKQKILDAVRRQPGIDAENLWIRVWDGPDGGPENLKLVHVHINQLNRRLAPFGLRVRGSRFYGYRLQIIQREEKE